MAYRPSFRRTLGADDAEPNLTPVMNLMVVLIPLLLSSAEFIKIGVLELNLPPAAGPITEVTQQPQEKIRTLDLAISITEKGFYITSSLAVLKSEEGDGEGPSIPINADGTYDYDALSLKLWEIKKLAEGIFPDAENIVIQANPTIDYQTLVSSMDAARAAKIENEMKMLFPQVSLSAGII